MSATFPSQMVRRAVACALGRCASESEITLRPTAPHQSNRLYDVYVDGEHLIAKEYLRADIPDAAQHEYEAFRYLAAYAGGIPMPRPIPTSSGRCFAILDGRCYRCHEWIDGTALPWHGHARSTAAAVGGVVARLHQLRLSWSQHLAPDRPSPTMNRWVALAESAWSLDAALRRAGPRSCLNRATRNDERDNLAC